MNSKNGWISLHRKLQDNPIWQDPNYLKLWIHCLFEASHTEHEHLVGNQMVKVERGEFVTGRFSLADDMNKGVKKDQQLSERTWWRYLKNLEKWQMLSIKVSNKFSVVTIDKYDFYQGEGKESDQQFVQQVSNSRPPNDQQVSTNNNGNKDNKENKENKKDKPVESVGQNYYLLFEKYLNRIPNPNQVEMVGTFLDDGLEFDLIEWAFNEASLRNKDFKYATGILNNCFKEGIRTKGQAEQRQKERTQEQQQSKQQPNRYQQKKQGPPNIIPKWLSEEQDKNEGAGEIDEERLKQIKERQKKFEQKAKERAN